MTEPAKSSALIADIGGTHVRFALTGPHGSYHDVAVLNCGDYPDFPSAAQYYLESVSSPQWIERGALAIASPVKGGRVEMTNLGWAFNIDEVRRQLDFETLRVINDFAAIAHCLPFLRDADRHQIGGGEAVPGKPAGVIGPGTGLGVSVLVPARDGHIVLDTEGGHVTLAAANAMEAELIEIVRKRFGHVSAERMLSGPGLVNLYQALAERNGAPAEELSPAEISARGLKQPDSLCATALQLFCTWLGTVAADLALSVGAHGGIYVAGGVAAKLGDAFVQSGFRQRFEDKGRFTAYLAAIPTYLITHPHPALLGLSGLLAEEDRPQMKRRLS